MALVLERLATDLRELRRHPGYRRNPLAVIARIATWALHCALGMPARARFKRWNVTLVLPPVWRGGGSTSIFLFREDYEPELMLLERWLVPGMIFVDGGANTGAYTLVAARLVGSTGRVLAFEPGPECFAALRNSVATNGLGQVVLRRQALSDSQATARLYHHRSHANSFGLGKSSDPNVSYEDVETTTVERALAEERLSHVDFIKLDVEGAQELVLRGSRSVLLNSRPVVLVEIDAGACRRLNLDPDGACRMLRDFGYRFYTLGTHGETVPLANFEGIRRVLAVHATHPLPQREAAA